MPTRPLVCTHIRRIIRRLPNIVVANSTAIAKVSRVSMLLLAKGLGLV